MVVRASTLLFSVIHRTPFIFFRRQSLKAGSQKKAAPKRLVIQEQIDNLGTRFYNDDINRAELLEGLFLLGVSYAE
jgi:hypothetical protein